jgi:peptidoglycan-N-acetylglucosamine deacetylase
MSDLFLRTPFWIRWYNRQALYQTGDKRILLTFDDGPHPRWTPQLLKTLDRFNLQGLFFLRGDHLQQYPDIAREAIDAGHQLCLHGMYHKSILLRSESVIREELQTQLRLFKELNLPTPIYARPPYGYFMRPYQRAVRSLLLTNMLWNLGVKDYKCENGKIILRRLLKLQQPGDIILLHDNSRCAGQMLTNLSDYIETSHERGIRFVSRGEKI